MKLYNKTKIPDDVLKAILKKSAQLIGARHGKVAVVVAQARSMNHSGHAVPGNRFPIKEWVDTDGGGIILRIPYRKIDERSMKCWNFDVVAKDVFKMMLHEWAHIKDYQKGTYYKRVKKRTPSGRRIKWENRPEERYAEACVHDALKKSNQPVEEINDLAIEIVNACKGDKQII